MGSYDNIVKIEEMRKRMEEGNNQAALIILDTMDTRKIKNMSDLSLIAEVYAQSERYEEAEKLFLKIYEKTKSRKSLYQLIDLSIKNSNVEDAQQYLNEYQKVAPKDFYKYIFQYKIDKLKCEPYEVLIRTLLTLKQTEYMEKWAYELAKTYYKAGMEKECVRECSDIILWFGEGVYVEKAKILRSYFSGETDKEKIMEELKRRAMEDTVRTTAVVESIPDITVQEEQADYEDDLKKDIQTIMTEGWSEEEEAYEEETDEVSSGRNDSIERIMTEEYDMTSEAEDSVQYLSEAAASEEEATISVEADSAPEFGAAEAIEGMASEEDAADTEAVTEVDPNDGDLPEETRSEREIAEQEVEHALYNLLDEMELDEDDRKLGMIAEQYDFLPEELFGNFLHVKAVKKQLVKSLEGILDEHTRTVQIILTGNTGSGKTALAKDITMFLYKTGKLKSSKIAKIKAEKLNGLDLMSRMETLRDCCLVVENASDLNRQTIESILELCNTLKGNIAVIFEENKKNMNKLFRECPRLMDLFKNRIHLPQYTQEDLMGFAVACLRQEEYQLNPKAAVILQHKIAQIMKQSEAHTHLEQISTLMQGAMNAADIRTGKTLSILASQGKLKDVDILTILPEDFTVRP